MILNCRLMRKHAPLLIGAVALASPLLESRLLAQIAFEYVKVADTSTTIPGAGGTFASFSTPQVNGYTVAFSGAKAGYTGIFTSSNGTLGVTVDTTMIGPGMSTPFTSFSGFELDSNQIAFTGSSSGMQGIYLSGANGISKIVNLNTPIPNGTGTFTGFSAPSLSNGNIAFVGSGAGQQGVYSNASGPLQVVANTSTAIPSGTSTFTAGSFVSPTLNGSDVSFVAGGSSGQQGVYTTTFSALHKVVNLSTPLPEGGGSFSAFTTVNTVYGTNSFGNGNNPAALQGIYSEYNGAISVVANATASIPGGTGSFTSFGTPSNWGGDAAFIGNGSAGQVGLYTNEYGSLNAVINNSSSLGGKVITSISTAGSPRAIGNTNGDNFAFIANFTDGSSALYVAEQNYNWSAQTSGAWDSSANWSFGLKPRTLLYTNIQPDQGATVTGPATPTTIQGLNINTNYQNGVADLVLQPSGPLSVQNNVSINYTGEVNVNGGTLITSGGVYVYGGYLALNGGTVNGGDLNNQIDYAGRPGTVSASGNIGAHVENDAIMQVLNTTAHFSNSINNNDEFQIISGQVQIDQDINNSGTLDVRNSILQFGTRLDNTGQFNVSFGTTDIFGSVLNDTNGQIILSGNSNTTFYDGVTNNGMTFRVSGGSTAVFFGEVSGTGSFTGTGSVFFEGLFVSGPALISMAGPTTFDATSTFEVPLGGPTAGSGYGQVNVTGQLSLDGTLQVTLTNGYVPAVGSTYNVLNWTSVNGSFATVPTTTEQNNLKMFWNTAQTATGMNLSLTRAYWDVQAGSYTQAMSGSGVELVKSTPGTATLTSTASYTGLTTLSAGKLIFSGGVAHSIAAVTGTGALQVSAGTTLTSDGVNLLSGTWIVNGSQVLRSSSGGGAYALFAAGNGAAALSGTSAILGSNLSFGAGAHLDLRNNALIIEATPGTKAALIAAIAGDVQSGAITSSTAASNAAYSLEIADNAVLGASHFGGLSVDNNSIIVTQALRGDANLDGVVNPSDLLIWANNFNNVSQYSVSTGDFNLDGVVNPSDLLIWANNFNNSIGGNGVPSITGGGLVVGGGTVATPEPASLALLGLGAMGLMVRRKSRRA